MTFRSMAASATSPDSTAATSASPHAPTGPGMARSWECFALSVERTAVPLQGLNTDLAILGLGRLRTTQETVDRKVADDLQNENKKLLHDVKTWLRPVSSVEDTYHENVSKVLPGTCEWLFSRPEYIDWHAPHSQTDRSLLWISYPHVCLLAYLSPLLDRC